ncbi:hypothetical protein SLEP1_g53507 [Rubroshorea leprosula]|uniref:Uncharacterized protein n=1 Tax=Rubroshorea leprosula TaxID=152421 RepID=A0AAV5MAH0_9ROSI|nr:hypothetical protein SLEP1_g53507 [Rubroshorea leprosula]
MAKVANNKIMCPGEDGELRKGPWTLEEDTLLTHYIARHGEGRWNILAKCAGLKRTGKSCRLRWLNYLKPDIKRGNLTPQEQLLILELHSKWGNRWSKIAHHLPGRTDNEIKNYWRTRVQKQARQLNIESNSKKFLDAVRCFWIPRLLQKVEQTSAAAAAAAAGPQNSITPKFSNFTVPSVSPVSSPLENPNQAVENLSSVTSNQSVINHPTDLINISDTYVPQYMTSPNAYVNTNTVYNNQVLLNDSYNDMEGLISVGSMSYDSSLLECQMPDANWGCDDMAYTLWNNMDDIWQLREIGERGN